MSAPSAADLDAPLQDKLGRTITDLRISITQRCNFACTYCLPVPELHKEDRSKLLSYEEIRWLVAILARMGVRRVRLTGGEPLVRRDVPVLVDMLKAVPGIEQVALTSNAYLLDRHAAALADAGLDRVNVSLDTLDPERFKEIARVDGLERVLRGIEAAHDAGLGPVRVNFVVVRGVNDGELEQFARFGRETPHQVRFLEWMPLDSGGTWERDKVVGEDEIVERIHARWPVEEVGRERASSTSRRWRWTDGAGEFGVIAPVTRPFCGACSRIRLTADGHLRTCLFSTWETPLLTMLRDGSTDAEIAAALRGAVDRKEPGHRINEPDFEPASRSMIRIGG